MIAARQQTVSKPAPAHPPLQSELLHRKGVYGSRIATGGESEGCHMNQAGLQRKVMPGSEASEVLPVVSEVLSSPGHALDPATRAFMEPRFGHDFSQVRVHTGPQAIASAKSVNALAYTVGRDIVLGSSHIASESRQGRELIAHELAHVMQQGGHTPSQMSNLRLTRPGDAAEREAHSAAAAVASGEAFRPQTRGGVALARQMDAGVPTDAGVSGGPRDAGPIAGVPVLSHAPERAPAPTPAPVPIATISAVTFRGTVNRIAPTKTATVPVTVSGLPAGGSVNIDIEGSGGANGTATVTAGATLTGPGTVTVRGDTQTTPGNAGKLKVCATIGGTVVARSPGFTVAAYPINYTDTYLSDINDGTRLGMMAQDGWSSDGSGAISELDQVEISERVDMQSRDNPPFTVAGATSATGGTSGYLAANSFTQDTFQMAKASIKTTGLAIGAWTRVQGQLCLFKCKRTGVTDVVMPASGYIIIQMVYNFALPPATSWKHMTFHVPSAITVEGRTATAGSGRAASLEHSL